MATAKSNVAGIRWNPTLARYIDSRGRMVPQITVRKALDQSLRNARGLAQTYAGQLAAGELTLTQWERAMRVLIKDVHIFSVAGSVGGWAQLGPAEYGRIGKIVRDQYEFLYGFAEDIASGKQKLTGVAARATLYVEAGRTSAEQQQTVSDADAGLDEERNVMGAAEHCPECPALSARRWVPRGTLPLPGRRQCRQRCKCHIERRMSPAERRRRAADRQTGRERTLETTAGLRARAMRAKRRRP